MSKHTPGPWEFVIEDADAYDLGWRIKAPNKLGALMGNITYYPWVPRNIADWLLIAAAPELYEALRELLAAGEHSITAEDDVEAMLRFGRATEAARAALAKVDA